MGKGSPKKIKGFWFFPQKFISKTDFSIAQGVLLKSGYHLMVANVEQPILIGSDDINEHKKESNDEGPPADRVGFQFDFNEDACEGSWVDRAQIKYKKRARITPSPYKRRVGKL